MPGGEDTCGKHWASLPVCLLTRTLWGTTAWGTVPRCWAVAEPELLARPLSESLVLVTVTFPRTFFYFFNKMSIPKASFLPALPVGHRRSQVEFISACTHVGSILEKRCRGLGGELAFLSRTSAPEAVHTWLDGDYHTLLNVSLIFPLPCCL